MQWLRLASQRHPKQKPAAARELPLPLFDKLESIIPDHVVTSRIEEVQEVPQHKKQLEGRPF